MSLLTSTSIFAWRERIVGCMPAAWQQRINSHVMPFLLKVEGQRGLLLRDGRQLGEIDFDQGQVNTPEQVLLKPHEVPLIVELPRSWVLSRQVALPLAARENLRQVISYELDRLTPFSAEQVFFDFTNLGPDSSGERLNVQVDVVPIKRVQPILDVLNTAGISVDVITAAGLGDAINFLPKAARPRIDFRRLARRGLPVLVVMALIGALLVMPLLQKRKIAIEMQQWERNARNQANVVLRLREKLDQELAELEATKELWSKAPPLVNVLKELTDLLPKHTSLQQLDIKGDEVVMRGLSSQASSLISLLENAPGFDDPHFLSPVTQQKGKELFNLSARIVMPFPLTGEVSKPFKKSSGKAAPGQKPDKQPADKGNASRKEAEAGERKS